MKASIFTLGLAAVLIGGCAGGGSVSGLTDPATNFVQGQAALDAALQTPSTGDPTGQLSDAVYKLNVAYSQEAKPERAAALAIALTSKSADEIADLFGVTISRSPGSSTNAAADKVMKLLAPWRFGANSQPVTPIELIGLSSGSGAAQSREYPDSPTPTQVKTALEAKLRDLQRVVTILDDATITALSSVVFTVADPNVPTARVRVGKGELLTVRANVRQVVTLLQTILSYEIGFSGYDSARTVATEFGTDANSGNELSRDRLLPSGAFLNLVSGGSSTLATALNEAKSAVTDTKAAGTEVSGRADSTSGHRWLLQSIGVTGTQLTNLGNDLDGVVNSTTTINLGTGTADMKFGNFLSSGSDLRRFVPNFRVTSSAGNYTFTPVAPTGADQTAWLNLFTAVPTYGAVTVSGSAKRQDVIAEFLNSLQGGSAK